MRKFILPIIIGVIIVIILIINTIDFGPLIISILEQNAHIDARYTTIEGNIFTGFRLKNYTIRLSETDSICGELAEIKYSLVPLRFSLPNVFELNLTQPTIYFKKKKGIGRGGEITIPVLHLGLRINLKNGKFFYENERVYRIEKISGLVFIDFVGGKLYLNTMNLSFTVPDYPLFITSANLEAIIQSHEAMARSIKIKGRGFSFEGEGGLSFKKERIFLKIKNSLIDLGGLNIYKGKVNLFGEVKYSKGKLEPKIRGFAEDIYPFEYFQFESSSFADTVFINIFDGKILNGNIFAQIKLLNLKNWQFETNFRLLNVAKLTSIESSILINGYLVYRDTKFFGFLNSPEEDGLNIDSLFFFGSTSNTQVILDSLFIKEEENKKSLLVQAEIDSAWRTKIYFDDFDISRFQKFFPQKGTISGEYQFTGNIKYLKNIVSTIDISGKDISLADININKFHLKTKNFKLYNPIEYLVLKLDAVTYKKYSLDATTLSIQNNNFSLFLKKGIDGCDIQGNLDTNYTGTMSYLCLRKNGIVIENISPTTFDLLNRKIGEISLSLIDGTLKGTLSPLNLTLTEGNLEKLGKFLGLKEKLTGKLKFIVNNNEISLEADNINFMGLSDGSVKLLGEYKNKGVDFKSLSIIDNENQEFKINGFLSLEESNLHLKFENVKPWVFPFLKPFLEQPNGSMSGEISFTGNFEIFKLSGSGEIKNGTFGIKVLATKFDSLESKVRFDGNKIVFESGRCRVRSTVYAQSATAYVTGSGMIKLEPRFFVRNLNFEFSFKDAPIQFPPFAYGKGSGNFSIRMKDKITSYNGNISVKEGIVPIDFGLRVEEEETKRNENWQMNLRLSAERNVWLRNREADIEFGGEIYVIKEQGPLYVSGNLETKRGNFYWLTHTFSIKRGSINFIPGEKVDPELDFWAELDTKDANRTIKIILHCFGPISEPIFEFFSEPPEYSEQDIITYLNLNITWRELESLRQGEYVGDVLPKSLLAWLESDVSRRIRAYTGLDYFRIETPIIEPDEKTKLTVGKYISRNLFITYTYDITTFSNEFNVEYFIDDRNEILIRKDEPGEYSLQYQYRIRF